MSFSLAHGPHSLFMLSGRRKKKKRILMAFGSFGFGGASRLQIYGWGWPEAKLHCDCHWVAVDAHMNIEQKTYLIKV